MKILLVDASFTSFYRFFATLRWYQLARKEEFKKIKDDNKYDWLLNEEFKQKYEKMYFDSIEKVLKKQKINDFIMIFCQDAPQNTLWRHKLIKSEKAQEQYKGERPDLEQKYNFKNLFKYTYQTIIPNAIKNKPYPIHQLKYDHTEADDIIAIISMYLERKKDNQEIIIVSGDDDFTQLGREKVSILNYRKKDLIVFKEKEGQEKLRLKIINGDKSDNIPSIFPKSRKTVNLKTRKLVKDNIEEMDKFLDENPDIKQKYLLNKKLIDFKEIPTHIQKPVLKDFKKILFNLKI